MTPEGKVKDDVKAFLKMKGVASLSRPVDPGMANGYYHMYVPSGYGDPALDFTGCYKGRFFSVETKGPNGEPSRRQDLIMEAVKAGGGFTTWADNANDIIALLSEWMNRVDRGGM